MIEISKSKETKAKIESVWQIISDLENEQKYWSALKSVKILKKKDNEIEREATVRRGPMGYAKSLQTLVLNPKERTSTLTMKEGPMLGTRRMALREIGKDRTRIDVVWEFDMKGVPGFAQGFVKDSMSDITESALSQIAEKATRSER